MSCTKLGSAANVPWVSARTDNPGSNRQTRENLIPRERSLQYTRQMTAEILKLPGISGGAVNRLERGPQEKIKPS